MQWKSVKLHFKELDKNRIIRMISYYAFLPNVAETDSIYTSNRFNEHRALIYIFIVDKYILCIFRLKLHYIQIKHIVYFISPTGIIIHNKLFKYTFIVD